MPDHRRYLIDDAVYEKVETRKMKVLKIIRKRSGDSYIKNSIFAFHKICNIKHGIDIKRYGTAE